MNRRGLLRGLLGAPVSVMALAAVLKFRDTESMLFPVDDSTWGRVASPLPPPHIGPIRHQNFWVRQDEPGRTIKFRRIAPADFVSDAG